MNENTAEKLEVEEETAAPELEVEVVDDTPEEDRNRPARTEGTKPDIPEDDEISSYKGDVQKRIKTLKYEYHEERRKKEAAEREKEEAVKHAERILQENNKLRKTLDDGEAVLVEQVKGKASAMIEAAKKEYKEAYEAGDPDKITEAQIKLNQAQNEAFRVQDYKPKPRAQEPEPKQVYTPAPVQKHEPTKEDKAWMAENDWFQKEGEEAMTGFALGVHQSLIKKGINPKIDPESYYGEIDKKMRATFPDYFNKNVVETEEVTAPPRQAGSVVAPPTRSAKKPRKVQLTSTQVSLARRLGLSNEQYAAQLLKEASNG
tara:strand:+ start:1891 stop:2841 length:951 start_codon:yes stop_codon:yes gene_type:complete